MKRIKNTAMCKEFNKLDKEISEVRGESEEYFKFHCGRECIAKARVFDGYMWIIDESERMILLSRQQVKKLLPLFLSFVENGNLKIDNPYYLANLMRKLKRMNVL